MSLERDNEVEGFPLLADDSSIDQDVESALNGSTAAAGAAPGSTILPLRWQITSPKAIVRLAALFKFVIVISGTLIMLPFFRILEDAFCHRYFNDTSPGFLDEKKCKDDGVQKNLAYFFGFFTVVNGIIGECCPGRSDSQRTVSVVHTSFHNGSNQGL